MWALLIPSFIFIKLFQNRKNLKKISVRYVYGFFYNEYKAECFYWEFIKILEKILVIIIVNYFASDSLKKTVLLGVTLFLYCLL